MLVNILCIQHSCHPCFHLVSEQRLCFVLKLKFSLHAMLQIQVFSFRTLLSRLFLELPQMNCRPPPLIGVCNHSSRSFRAGCIVDLTYLERCTPWLPPIFQRNPIWLSHNSNLTWKISFLNISLFCRNFKFKENYEKLWDILKYLESSHTKISETSSIYRFSFELQLIIYIIFT